MATNEYAFSEERRAALAMLRAHDLRVWESRKGIQRYWHVEDQGSVLSPGTTFMVNHKNLSVHWAYSVLDSLGYVSDKTKELVRHLLLDRMGVTL